MATTTIATSEKFSLNIKDAVRGLLMAIIGAALGGLHEIIIKPGGIENINWKVIWGTAVITAVSYLIKNFFTPAEIVLVDPPKAAIEAVKDGATVKVIK